MIMYLVGVLEVVVMVLIYRNVSKTLNRDKNTYIK